MTHSARTSPSTAAARTGGPAASSPHASTTLQTSSVSNPRRRDPLALNAAMIIGMRRTVARRIALVNALSGTGLTACGTLTMLPALTDRCMHVLGLDAGGMKTVCLLADGQGTVLASARGPGANLQVQGELEVEKTLHHLMEETLGSRPFLPDAVCLGIAGVDRPDDAAIMRGIMRRIGYKTRALVVNDALIALVAAVQDGAGIVIVCGTGSICYGRNGRGEAARAGGWGYLLGDEGSGYWIGRRALTAATRHADGRGPATALTAFAMEHFGVAAVS